MGYDNIIFIDEIEFTSSVERKAGLFMGNK